ncbi:MAG: FkbM family methyltransferase [Anaerolineae bacterium]|nr:FkbM family methyltransferase [Anaerolineae bacterium]
MLLVIKRDVMRSLYLRLRRYIPQNLANALRQLPLVKRVVRRLRPVDNQIHPMQGPLSGHRMILPLEMSVYDVVWGQYETFVCDVIEKYVTTGMRALDVGAHIGYFSLLLKKHVGSTGKVISFEPTPESRRILQLNLDLNHADVRVEPMAVGDRVALMRLQRGRTAMQAHLSESTAERLESTLIVPVCDLDSYFELLDWPQVDFIKLDIEGTESRAIHGMARLIERFHPILLIETHGEIAREGLLSLQAAGYSFERRSANGQALSIDWGSEIGNEHWLATVEKC